MSPAIAFDAPKVLCPQEDEEALLPQSSPRSNLDFATSWNWRCVVMRLGVLTVGAVAICWLMEARPRSSPRSWSRTAPVLDAEEMPVTATANRSEAYVTNVLKAATGYDVSSSFCKDLLERMQNHEVRVVGEIMRGIELDGACQDNIKSNLCRDRVFVPAAVELCYAVVKSSLDENLHIPLAPQLLESLLRSLEPAAAPLLGAQLGPLLEQIPQDQVTAARPMNGVAEGRLRETLRAAMNSQVQTRCVQ